ncbi:MAG: NYN domain-containing protein [Aquificae bacterium]|nr:NYN domain-containing protein [Aquificota bacterium]
MLELFTKKTKIEYRYPNEKVAIFIDGANMFHASNYLKLKIDYRKLIEILRRDRWLLRAYFYTGIPADRNLPPEIYQQFKKQQNFLNELSNIGIKVKTMPLKRTPEGFIEKGIDILLATDMVSLAFRDAYDTAILVSGDSDYVPVVEEIQTLGKRVENVTFKRESSFHLRKVCDSYLILDEIKDEFTTSLNGTSLPKPVQPSFKSFFKSMLEKIKSLSTRGKK